MNLSVFTYQGRCALHGIFPNVPRECIICEENDDIKNGLIKRPTYGNKEHITKILCFIGEFHRVNYQPMIKKYSYNRISFFL